MGPQQDIWVLRGTFFVCGSTFFVQAETPKTGLQQLHSSQMACHRFFKWRTRFWCGKRAGIKIQIWEEAVQLSTLLLVLRIRNQFFSDWTWSARLTNRLEEWRPARRHSRTTNRFTTATTGSRVPLSSQRTFSTENTKWTGFTIIYSENKNTDYTKENTKYAKQNTKYSISIKRGCKKICNKLI